MGFKVCAPHKLKEDWREPCRMVLDKTIIESKYINGKWVRVETNKVHPKWQRFYNLDFDETLKIWIKANQSVIYDIWVEGSSIEDGAKNIYNHNQVDSKISNNRDIIKKLPKRVQRDFILNDIFK